MTTITKLNDDVWTIDHPMSLFGIRLGTRSTIVRLPSDRLVVIGPVPFDDATAARIDEFGTVDAIVAPNPHHHLYFPAACNRWPDATPLVAPPLVDRDDIPSHAEPMDATGNFEDALHWVRLDGAPKLCEHAFVDTTSGVLVLTDLAFNFGTHPHWWTRLFLKVYGAHEAFGPTRLIRFLIKDDDALAKSLVALLDYDWDALVVAHGDVVPEDGREKFLDAFSRYLPDDFQARLPDKSTSPAEEPEPTR